VGELLSTCFVMLPHNVGAPALELALLDFISVLRTCNFSRCSSCAEWN